MCRESFQSAINCYKFSAKIEKMLSLQVTAREVMTFFENQHHLGLQHAISGGRCPEKWGSSKQERKGHIGVAKGGQRGHGPPEF